MLFLVKQRYFGIWIFIAMNELGKQIGINIRHKRNELNIKQDELALLSEIDRSYMGRIERGEVNLTVEKLYKIAFVLKCEAKELLPVHANLNTSKIAR